MVLCSTPHYANVRNDAKLRDGSLIRAIARMSALTSNHDRSICMSAPRDASILPFSCISHLSTPTTHSNSSSRRQPNLLTRYIENLCFPDLPLIGTHVRLGRSGTPRFRHCPTRLNAACPTRHEHTFLFRARRLTDSLA